MADTPLFQVGGLASGLDTQSIIDGLTKIEQQPLDALRTQQTDFKTQVSVIGQLVGKIQTLQQAAKALSTNGAVGVKATTVNTDFTATPSSQTQAGSYQVSVQSLATAAQQRTVGFTPDASGITTVKGGTLQLTVQGKTYDPITITDGMSLGDVAGAIRATGRADQRGRAQQRHPAVPLGHRSRHRVHRCRQLDGAEDHGDLDGHAGPVARLRAGGPRRAATRWSPSTGCSSRGRATPSPTRSPARR